MDNKPKHTPGPWIVRADQRREHKLYVVDSEERIQCEMFNTVSDSKANAQLIAAAPELLSALEALINAGYTEDRYEAMQKANSAIKKAKGQ